VTKVFRIMAATVVAAGCASSPQPAEVASRGGDSPAPVASAPRTAGASGAQGAVEVVVTNIAEAAIEGRVDLIDSSGAVAATIPFTEGRGAGTAPAGGYTAEVYAFDERVPVMVALEEVEVNPTRPVKLQVELLEGAGTLSLLHFDQDYDFVLDRLELEAGTDPTDASSFPGAIPVPLPANVINPAPGWYAGDLHVRSRYSPHGTESVAELVKRAEQAGLDFLAIADRNTLEATRDPGFKSSRLALIPAMEWGTNEKGVVLIYGPRTVPRLSNDFGDAQAMVVRMQAQGAFVAIAHPCFPTMPWQWGLSYMSGVQVWARDWSGVPPAVPQDLSAPMLETKDGTLIHSVARAVSMRNQSANGQASLFYDMELVRQLKASAIAGSLSGSAKVPIGQPVTYIYARNLSAPALIEGLLMGRTFVSSGKNGPRVFLRADVMDDGSVDVPMVGGSVPVGVPVRFEAVVYNAKGKKLQMLRNGVPEGSLWVDSDNYAWSYMRVPDGYSAFRARIVDTVEDHRNEYGHLKVLAMTSPIYADNILPQIVGPNLDPDLFRLRIESYYEEYNRLQREGLPADPRPYELQFHR
jgi:hypothetical protein